MAHLDDPPPERSSPTAEDYEAAWASPEFIELRRRVRSFAFPMTVAFMAWYFLYVLLSTSRRYRRTSFGSGVSGLPRVCSGRANGGKVRHQPKPVEPPTPATQQKQRIDLSSHPLARPIQLPDS